MKQLARLYWRHEVWVLQSIVEKEFFVAFLRQQTLVVWYVVPMIAATWAVVAYDGGGVFFWVLFGIAVISFAWAALGFIWLTFSMGYLGDAVDFGWNSKVQPTASQKRLDRLKQKIGKI